MEVQFHVIVMSGHYEADRHSSTDPIFVDFWHGRRDPLIENNHETRYFVSVKYYGPASTSLVRKALIPPATKQNSEN
ncbi:hypothetical protein ACTXT7_011275 [Hymenolepis weldensis]